MTRKPISRKLIFLPWAISVFLLCVGSLINFHQYRIWHRPLLPEFVAYKRDSEKTLDHTGLQSFFHPAPVHFILLDAAFSEHQDIRSYFDLDFNPAFSAPGIPFLSTHRIHGMRAPPLA